MSAKQTKWIAAFLSVVLLLCACYGCSTAGQEPDSSSRNSGTDEGKVQIVATLFPQYDFAREIAGDRAEITLLLSPGVESHSYEPTPGDIVTINNADVFLYTGPYMEVWAQSIVDSLTGDVLICDVSQGVSLLESGEEEEATGEGHDHTMDPHIWTDPNNAMEMVKNITNALCEVDQANQDYYREREQAYLQQLEELDASFQSIVDSSSRKELVFGGRFALQYFTHRYGLTAVSAYDSCSHETEPSVAAIAEIIDRVQQDQIPVVYYEELTDPKVTRTICEATGAQMLLFHSCHNVSKDEFDGGATYLSLMQQNAENLKKGLS